MLRNIIEINVTVYYDINMFNSHVYKATDTEDLRREMFQEKLYKTLWVTEALE